MHTLWDSCLKLDVQPLMNDEHEEDDRTPNSQRLHS
jgi:hypothetical protein